MLSDSAIHDDTPGVRSPDTALDKLDHTGYLDLLERMIVPVFHRDRMNTICHIVPTCAAAV